MKKKISYILLLASVFAMASCGETTSNSESVSSSGSISNSTSNKPSEITSESTSSKPSNSTSDSVSTKPSNSTSDSVSKPSTSVAPQPVFDVPSSISEIKANIDATKIKGYSFEDDSSKKANGDVTFNKNEILIKGKATVEDDGSLETGDLLIYKGFNDTTFYDIENYLGKHAKRKNIVSNVEDEKAQISLDDAKKEIDGVMYNKTWFQKNVSNILVDGATFTSKTRDDFYELTVTFVNNRTINKAKLSFDENNQLLEGQLESNTWPSDNFDSETNEPIDASQKPTSSSKYKATFVLGEDNKEEITFDVSKYYITSIDEFYVSSYSDKENNDGKAEAGQYVDVIINKFSPATALNVDEFKIVESSDTSVIEINSFTGSAKAVKSGEATLTIADPIRSVTVTKKVTVTSPSLNSIWISITNKTLKVDDTATITVQAYPTASEEELEAISSDPTVVEIGGISADRKSLSIKGLKEGTSNITVRSKNNPDVISRALTITVEKKQDEQSNWLIGTWKNTTTAINEDDDIITFNTTFTFNSDGSGKIVQKVTRVNYDNEAEFKWTYDGITIKFSSWYSEENTLSKPTNVVIAEDKSSISLIMPSQDNNDKKHDLNMQLLKENEAAWLIGTWSTSLDKDDFGDTTVVFNENGTGTIKSKHFSDATFKWSYTNSKLVITELSSSEYSIKSTTTNAEKAQLEIHFSCDGETCIVVFKK